MNNEETKHRNESSFSTIPATRYVFWSIIERRTQIWATVAVGAGNDEKSPLHKGIYISERATNRNGHRPKRPQTEKATDRNGHKPKRPQTETAADRNGHKPERPHHIRT